MAAILKAIRAGVGFGSGTETTIVRKIDVFGGNIRDSQLEHIASNQECIVVKKGSAYQMLEVVEISLHS